MHLIVSVHTAANWCGWLQNECTVRRLWRRPNQPLRSCSWLLRWVCEEHESTDDSTSVSNTGFKFIVKFRQNGIPLSWRLWQNPQMLCVIMSNEDTNSSCGLPRISSFPAAWCKFGSLSGSISKNISLVDHFSLLFVCRRQTRKNKSSNTVQEQDTCKNKTRLQSEDQWMKNSSMLRGIVMIWIIVIVWDARFFKVILGFLLHVS